MLLGKKRKLGRNIKDISIGEKLSLTEKIEDKELLLYLGLTNDANPLYIQHDYASQTPYKKPLVPSIMLTGIIISAISKYLPGPGSHILKHELTFQRPIYHYTVIQFNFEVTEILVSENKIVVSVQALSSEEEILIDGSVTVSPPSTTEQLEGNAIDNF